MVLKIPDADQVARYLKTLNAGTSGDPFVLVREDESMCQSTPTTYNLTLTLADTEYSQAIPAGTRSIMFKSRNGSPLRYAFQGSKVAGPTPNYLTLESGECFGKENLKIVSLTLYCATDDAGDVVEILGWS